MNNREGVAESLVELEKKKSNNTAVGVSIGSVGLIGGTIIAIVGMGPVSVAGGVIIGIGVAGGAVFKAFSDKFDVEEELKKINLQTAQVEMEEKTTTLKKQDSIPEKKLEEGTDAEKIASLTKEKEALLKENKSLMSLICDQKKALTMAESRIEEEGRLLRKMLKEQFEINKKQKETNEQQQQQIDEQRKQIEMLLSAMPPRLKKEGVSAQEDISVPQSGSSFSLRSSSS